MADMTTTIITEDNVGDVAKTIRNAIAQKGSASKLTNTRKLWGKSFDGSSDIDSSIEVTSHLWLRDSAKQNLTEWLMKDDGLHIQALSLQTGVGNKIFISENGGNVQIGNTSKSAKLAIGGTLHADGNITGGADITASGNVIGMSGVSAKGIADFSVTNTGGSGGADEQSTKVTITNSSMSEGTSGAGITAYKQGNQVTLQGSFLYNRMNSTSAVVVCNIPQDYRPSHDINVIQSTTTEVMWRARISASNGNFTLRDTFTPSTGAVTDSTQRTYCISITYFI